MYYVKRGCEYLCGEIVYLIVSCIYLIFLNDLNHTLLRLFDEKEYFKILAYNNYLPVMFFLFALVFFATGVFIISYRIKQIKRFSLELLGLIYCILSILIVLMVMISIFIFINNPIMRAIMACIFLICVFAASE